LQDGASPAGGAFELFRLSGACGMSTYIKKEITHED